MGGKLIMAGLALAGLTAFGAGTAVAAQNGASTGGTSASNNEDRSRRVCRTVVPSGSRLGERVCRTSTEWERSREQTRRYVEDGQNNGYAHDGAMNGRGQVGPPR